MTWAESCKFGPMGITRSDLFSKRQNELSEQLKALSHPARLAIVEHLMDQSSCINSGFVELTGLAQSTVTRHLGVLVASGLVTCSCSDGRSFYCIEPQAWEALRMSMAPFFEGTQDQGLVCKPANESVGG